MSLVALLGVLLSGCVTPAPAVPAQDEALEAVFSWEEARADPTCVVPLCDDERCALWRCRDVLQGDTPTIVPARAPMALRPPLPGTPRRWWGHPLGVPSYAEPVFEIPWNNWKVRQEQTYRENQFCIPWREPVEKHHIFPQEPLLADWFRQKHIDIHAFTIRIPKSRHEWVHSGGSKGGQWNEAWRQFRDDNPGATAEEMWLFAFQLMLHFRIDGPFVSYYCK